MDRNIDGKDKFNIEKIHKGIEVNSLLKSDYGFKSRIQRFIGRGRGNILIYDSTKGGYASKSGCDKRLRENERFTLMDTCNCVFIDEDEINSGKHIYKCGVVMGCHKKITFNHDDSYTGIRKRIKYALENDCTGIAYKISDSLEFLDRGSALMEDVVTLHKESQIPPVFMIDHLSLNKQEQLVEILYGKFGETQEYFIQGSLELMFKTPDIYKKNILISETYTDSPIELFYLCKEAVNTGVIGITLNKSIESGENPLAMIQVIRLILDKGISVSKAQKFYEILKYDTK